MIPLISQHKYLLRSTNRWDAFYRIDIMKFTKLSPAIGAEISGIDLGHKLSQDTLDDIYQALIENMVIFFRNQYLSAKSQLEFSESFGSIDKPHAVYPHVEGFPQVVKLENDADRPADTNAWHTDLSFYESPPFASVLHARAIPEVGGDTLWSSMYAAYDALPEEMQKQCENLQAIHDPGSFRNQFLGENQDIGNLNKSMGRVGSAVHSIVKTHPATGRKYLYVNQSFTNQVVDYLTPGSNRLLSYLYDYINIPEFQVWHKWQKGDVG